MVVGLRTEGARLDATSERAGNIKTRVELWWGRRVAAGLTTSATPDTGLPRGSAQGVPGGGSDLHSSLHGLSGSPAPG